MPCSPGVSCETFTLIFTPWAVAVIFAVPIVVPWALTISAWAEVGAAANNRIVAENDKSPAITKSVLKRIASSSTMFRFLTAWILSHAYGPQNSTASTLRQARTVHPALVQIELGERICLA